MLNNMNSGWISWKYEELSQDERLERFNHRLTREDIPNQTKDVILKVYREDLNAQIGL